MSTALHSHPVDTVTRSPEAKSPLQHIADLVRLPRVEILAEREGSLVIRFGAEEIEIQKSDSTYFIIEQSRGSAGRGYGSGMGMGLRMNLSQQIELNLDLAGIFQNQSAPKEYWEAMIFHELREIEYIKAGIPDPHQRAMHDDALYALIYLPNEEHNKYFEWAHEIRERAQREATAKKIYGSRNDDELYKELDKVKAEAVTRRNDKLLENGLMVSAALSNPRERQLGFENEDLNTYVYVQFNCTSGHEIKLGSRWEKNYKYDDVRSVVEYCRPDSEEPVYYLLVEILFTPEQGKERDEFIAMCRMLGYEPNCKPADAHFFSQGSLWVTVDDQKGMPERDAAVIAEHAVRLWKMVDRPMTTFPFEATEEELSKRGLTVKTKITGLKMEQDDGRVVTIERAV